jgi:hypothetical protein
VIERNNAQAAHFDHVLLIEKALMKRHGGRAVRRSVVTDQHVYPARVRGRASEQQGRRVAGECRTTADLEKNRGGPGRQLVQPGPVDDHVFPPRQAGM